jgi:hypothetical protein
MRASEFISEISRRGFLGALGAAAAGAGVGTMLGNREPERTNVIQPVPIDTKPTAAGSAATTTPAYQGLHWTPETTKKLKQVAERVGINWEVLLNVIKIETGGTMDPRTINKNSNTVGITQMNPAVAAALGTSTQSLLNMSAEQQLDFVERYFSKHKNKLPSNPTPGDIYMINFLPAFAKAEVPDDKVLAIKPGTAVEVTKLGKKAGKIKIGSKNIVSNEDPPVTYGGVWRGNPAFHPTDGRKYFTKGDVKRVFNQKAEKLSFSKTGVQIT